MKRLLMSEQWNEFAQKCLPNGVGPTQRREMRRAFYAGAQSILFRVIAGFAPESEPTEADLNMMSELARELSDFAEAVKAGKA